MILLDELPQDLGQLLVVLEGLRHEIDALHGALVLAVVDELERERTTLTVAESALLAPELRRGLPLNEQAIVQ